MTANGLNRLRPYAKNLFVAACALLMIGAYMGLSPWLVLDNVLSSNQAAAGMTFPEGFTPPAGMTLPEGFTPPAGMTFPEGFTPPASMTLPEGFTPPAGMTAPTTGSLPTGAMSRLPLNRLQMVVPLAGAVALFFAALSAWRPRLNRLATHLTFVAGLVALASYVATFALDAALPLPFNLVDLMNSGFWLGLMGSSGLLLQIALPRPSTEIADDGQAHRIVPQARRGGMNITQNLGVAVDALLANKMRSALTMLGIIIGVASVVSLLSVGQGAQASITQQIASTGLNLLTITPGANSLQNGPPRPGGAASSSTDTLTYGDAQALARSIDGLTAVLPQYSGTLTVRSENDTLQTTILGTVEQYADARSIDIEIGRYLSTADREGYNRVAVLGQQAAAELFGGLNPVGRTVRINSKQFTVVGVLGKQDGGFGSNPNLQIHVPLTTAYRQLFDARQTGSTEYKVTSIVVAVADLEQVTAITEAMTALLRERHRLDADEDDDFSILDQQSLLDTASAITGILTVLLGAIASVSLLVGGIGIMNIMLVSVTERTKEIGLRKAIGARRSHILQQFLIETVFLSVLGGFLGVLLGVAIALLVNASGVLTTTISPSSIALGLGFSALVGIFFGVYPANQAAALEPIEALRYE